ncbi:MAG: hypothetical protein FWD23_17400 [Oscillospiraceae bacterium]|nr:hypothetical protein [Oscillospiraceae bacterium]
MDNILNGCIVKKSAPTASKAESNDIVEIKSDIIPGLYINDREVETRRDRFFYKNGKVLTKVYRNERLCMIQIAVT